MKAIQVKYLSMTETKPARLKAFIKGFSATVLFHSCDDEGHSDNEPYDRAVQALVYKIGWTKERMDREIVFQVGTLPNEDRVYLIVKLGKTRSTIKTKS